MTTDLSRTPMTLDQVAVLAALRVPIMTDKYTGHIYVLRRYWNRLNPKVQDAIVRAVSP